jgi:hypothetical protein
MTTEMPIARKERDPFYERTMWKDIERYFLKRDSKVWTTPGVLKGIVGFIPDVVTEVENYEFGAVEVKRTITTRNFKTALGQCIRFRKFATRIYLAHKPIPDWVIEELKIIASEIGILSINNLGYVKVIRDPTAIKQTNQRLLEILSGTLYLRTKKFGPSRAIKVIIVRHGLS